MLVTLMLFQATIISGPPEPAKAPPSPRSVAPTRCPRDAKGDIVVCGSTDRNEQYRLRPLPERYQDPNRAIVALPGNAKLMPEIQQGRRFGEGQVALSLKIPF